MDPGFGGVRSASSCTTTTRFDEREGFLRKTCSRILGSTVLTAILFAARQVLPAAVLPGEGEHTARRDGGNEEGIQEAPESRTGDHGAVESEGRRYHDGVGPTRRGVTGERALHGGRVPDGDTGDRGYRLHH